MTDSLDTHLGLSIYPTYRLIEARAARWDSGGGSGGARMCWPARLANTNARCRRRKS